AEAKGVTGVLVVVRVECLVNPRLIERQRAARNDAADEVLRLFHAAVRALRGDRIIGNRGIAECSYDATARELPARTTNRRNNSADEPSEWIGELHLANERRVPWEQLHDQSLHR